ncbi:radical SAM/SPASM domain-containing protein [Helicobacter aurati]|uniref:Radical SAM/SPASM domain-containing protein n=1 Tax=Helicobacter aurati TaxID=137778 RepID=A0A3D8J7E4_9HELI|nr:SPASM domain-containing protein [Helicobacter aurati]RDU73115.1 radical SAM/SPASM domain-containing protein [Helicobacter aurati]
MKRFEKIYIELTDYCGLCCGFCPNSRRIQPYSWQAAENPHVISSLKGSEENNKGQSLRTIMPLSLFQSLCEQITGKTRRVCLHILGDPLSIHNLVEYIEILRFYKLQVDLVTTGLFLRQSDFAMLTAYPFVQISFSLSAFLANPNRLHDIHLQRIFAFCDYNLMQESPIFINLRLHNKDIASNSPYFREILRNIASHFNIPHENVFNQIYKRVRLAKKTLLVATRSFEWIRKDSINDVLSDGVKTKPRRFCHGAYSQIGILCNGDVVPCCIDYSGAACFGSIKTQKLHQILTSKVFQEFKHKLGIGEPASSLCEKCGYVVAR